MWWCYWQGNGLAIHRSQVQVLDGHHCVVALDKLLIYLLYTLKILKRCSLSRHDLWHFYVTAVRPLLEHACPAWYTSLNQEQSRRLYGHGDYVASCSYYKISPLVDRRNQLCKQFLLNQCYLKLVV